MKSYSSASKRTKKGSDFYSGALRAQCANFGFDGPPPLGRTIWELSRGGRVTDINHGGSD